MRVKLRIPACALSILLAFGCTDEIVNPLGQNTPQGSTSSASTGDSTSTTATSTGSGGTGGQGGTGQGGTGGMLAGSGGAAGQGGSPIAPMADFSLIDDNAASQTYNQPVSPRDYLMRVSAWYFGHST